MSLALQGFTAALMQDPAHACMHACMQEGAPVEVISIIAMSPFLTMSPMLGLPSWIFSTTSQSTPLALRCLPVPPVLMMLYPNSCTQQTAQLTFCPTQMLAFLSMHRLRLQANHSNVFAQGESHILHLLPNAHVLLCWHCRMPEDLSSDRILSVTLVSSPMPKGLQDCATLSLQRAAASIPLPVRPSTLTTIHR